jgi:dihydropteroate synthase
MIPDDHPGGGLTAPFFASAWDLGRLVLEPPGRPLVMGIVNLTPDSFYPGSRCGKCGPAVEHALRLAEAGADLLDLGAESSRPGAESVGETEELDRLLPVLETLRPETRLPLTVDTVRSGTAKAALDAGVDGINDISAGILDPDMIPLAAARKCGLVLMHMRGAPRTMQDDPGYSDVIAEVSGWLATRYRLARDQGVAAERILVDPGIGFGKTLAHNLALLGNLGAVGRGCALLLGASRKRFIGDIADAEVAERLPGSLAALAYAWQGGASVVRVHDVKESVQYLEVLKAVASHLEPKELEGLQP